MSLCIWNVQQLWLERCDLTGDDVEVLADGIRLRQSPVRRFVGFNSKINLLWSKDNFSGFVSSYIFRPAAMAILELQQRCLFCRIVQYNFVLTSVISGATCQWQKITEGS